MPTARRSRRQGVTWPGEGRQGLLGEICSQASGGARTWAQKGVREEEESLALDVKPEVATNTLALAQLLFAVTWCLLSGR